ncbi:hypothetical protein AX15_004074 [Amanita polypyramis BW_CC]|nr:hypothetical protein AX15_004074 [Amanita polypyramis BW_CC]
MLLTLSVPQTPVRFLPEWFPGAGFKKTAKAWRKILHDMAEGPNQFAKQQIELGVAKPSMLSNLLQDESKLSDEEIHDIKWASTSLYAGGADIVVAAIHAFFKAMVLHPDVQAQAQAEIDAVIGNERLLNIEDRRRLLYISALAMEVLRCHVVTPNGGPHRVTEDDIHDGYLIPKGALILPNVWKMTRDASVYKFPSSFNLARYIKTEDHEPEFDPRYMVWKKESILFYLIFHYANLIRRPYPLSIFISCAMTLAVFDTTPYMEDGKPIMPDVKQSTGIIRQAPQFPRCLVLLG